MNRALFISDFKRLSRQFGPEELPEALASYVKDNYMPKDLKGKKLEGSVNKDKIIEVVCQFYDTTFDKIIAGGRYRPVMKCKKVLVYLITQRTILTLREIASLIGYTDHTSVMHVRDTLIDQMDVDRSLRQEVEHLNNQL